MPIDVLMPSLDPSMQTGRLTRWLRREGDYVEAGDPIAEVATERATMDVEAPQAGVLTRILIAAGALDVPVFQQIGVIEPAEARPAKAATPARAILSPRARRIAREAGLDVGALEGSGPNGRIVERDVRARLDGDRPHRAPRARDSGEAPGLQTAMDAARFAPQVHLEADCRLDALELLRRDMNASARQAEQTRISLVDCVVKAFALALQRVPGGNVMHAAGGFAPARQSDIALAIAVGDRILTPAIASAERLSLAEIAAARADFMAGRFAPASFHGGTSLVANLGGFGVRRFTPSVVAPWTSALGLGAAEKRVIVHEGKPEVATMLSVTLSIDRRAMDEMAGGALLAAFRHLVENPAGLQG